MSDKPPSSDTPDASGSDASEAGAPDTDPEAASSEAADPSSSASSAPGDATEESSQETSSSETSSQETSSQETSSQETSGSDKGVPPEKAPPRASSQKRAAEASDADSPASALKGLQKGEEKERRGLLARSKRLQNLLLSNRPLGVRNMLWATLAVLAVIAGLLAATGRIGTVTQSIARSFSSAPGDDAAEARPLEEVAGDDGNDGTFTFAELADHPDNVLQPYFSGTIAGSGEGKSRADLVRQFRGLIDRFINRMKVDDNFSLRVTSGGEVDSLLEVFTLEEERQKYIDAGRPENYNWGRIDQLRRQKTRQLVDKWVARGIPKEPMHVKWGMATKTREARRRDKPFIEYEVRLARFFGKSLLMTEIGTKETFNQDELVSSVGAKSRYQLMPNLLASYGVHRYRLPTSAGNSILVAEEHHPLLTMEPAFKHATASINAMGSEIPGISAYHTGVNNIYNEVFVKFLRNAQGYISPSLTTADAYMWGVTEGYDIVSRNSSFGDFSREYVISAYAALKAMEDATIDTSQTMLGDRVQLAEGQSITLNDLLTTLAKNGGADLPWNTPDSLTLYDRFRHLNKHFHLPAGPDAGGDSVTVGVPERGNVALAATAQGDAVRFFLPPGARGILKNNGLADLIDESSVFRFNHDTYPDPRTNGMLTKADRQYDELIDEIRRFGFTDENRQKLKRLTQEFEQLAASEPTHYRRLMRDIIAKHRQFWRYPGWENVAQATRAVLGRTPVKPQKPQPLPTQPMQAPENVGAPPEAGR